MSETKLGQIPPESAKRDAIHVAVAPIVAGDPLYPGQHVKMRDGKGWPAAAGEGIGIVDPFLTRALMYGDRFWLILYPGSVQNLRHDWDHAAIARRNP
jgi:hypothetical protein